MVKGTLKNGFKYEINPDVINQWKFLYLSKKADEDGVSLVALFEYMLGEEQMLALIEHLGGDPTTEEVQGCIMEMLGHLGENEATKK